VARTRINNGGLQNTSSGYTVQWELREYKRKPRRLRNNWVDMVRRDLKDMGTT